MVQIRITKDTFIKGRFVARRWEGEVDEETAAELFAARRAVEISGPKGKPVVEDNSGVMETIKPAVKTEKVLREVEEPAPAPPKKPAAKRKPRRKKQ